VTALAIIHLLTLTALIAGLVAARGTVRGWPWVIVYLTSTGSGVALAVGSLA